VLCEALAKVGGEALPDEAADEAGERGGDGNQDPEEGGEADTGDGHGLERDGNGGVVELDMDAADVGNELHAVDDEGGEEKGGDGEGADAEEEDIDGAGDALPAAAVGALVEVGLVVGAHGWGDAGDIEAPAGEDATYDRVSAVGD